MNICRPLVFTMGWFQVSLKHTYTNFHKNDMPKKSLDAALIFRVPLRNRLGTFANADAATGNVL